MNPCLTDRLGMQHTRHSAVPWQQRCFLHVVEPVAMRIRNVRHGRIREEIRTEQEILRKRRINLFP